MGGAGLDNGAVMGVAGHALVGVAHVVVKARGADGYTREVHSARMGAVAGDQGGYIGTTAVV